MEDVDDLSAPLLRPDGGARGLVAGVGPPPFSLDRAVPRARRVLARSGSDEHDLLSLRRPAAAPPAKTDENPAEDQPGDGLLLVHVVDASKDTLQGLSLRYGCSMDALKRANDLSSDRLNSHISLVIPPACSSKSRSQALAAAANAKLSDHLDPALWPVQRIDDDTLARLCDLLQRSVPNMSPGEARFYLLENGFDIARAVRHAERDVEWERGQGSQKSVWARLFGM
jgi:hypothetical protein